jgi:hypothetical protein
MAWERAPAKKKMLGCATVISERVSHGLKRESTAISELFI